jgi:hypothetical protein
VLGIWDAVAGPGEHVRIEERARAQGVSDVVGKLRVNEQDGGAHTNTVRSERARRRAQRGRGRRQWAYPERPAARLVDRGVDDSNVCRRMR